MSHSIFHNGGAFIIEKEHQSEHKNISAEMRHDVKQPLGVLRAAVGGVAHMGSRPMGINNEVGRPESN